MSSTATSIVRSSTGGISSGRWTCRDGNGRPGRATGHSVTQNCLPKRSLFRQAMGMRNKSTSLVGARLRARMRSGGCAKRAQRRRHLEGAIDEIGPRGDRGLHQIEIGSAAAVVLSVEAGQPRGRAIAFETVADGTLRNGVERPPEARLGQGSGRIGGKPAVRELPGAADGEELEGGAVGAVGVKQSSGAAQR